MNATIVSLIKLEQLGFKFNRNLGKLFAYCGRCKRYEYHSWMGRDDWQEIVVCDKCNYCSNYRYSYYDKH